MGEWRPVDGDPPPIAKLSIGVVYSQSVYSYDAIVF